MNMGTNKPMVARLEQTCEFIPAQWEGRTTDDRPLYIRAKHGVVSARIGPMGGTISDAVRGEELLRMKYEDADVLSSAEMTGLLAEVFDFSQMPEIEPYVEPEIPGV
jgi:hypothetical protein